MYNDAQVYDSLGKRIGKVSKVINSDYIIVTKTGLISDEEYQIPISCVSHFNSSDDNLSITLSIDQSCLKHGFEVISGASGGAIPATHEPELIPTTKETIRYTVDEMQYGDIRLLKTIALLILHPTYAIGYLKISLSSVICVRKDSTIKTS